MKNTTNNAANTAAIASERNVSERTILHWLTYFLAILVILATANIFSQGKYLPPAQIFYSASNDANNPMPQTTMPAPREKSELEKQLERQLETARTSNNTMASRQIQSQLDKLRGGEAVFQPAVDLNLPGADVSSFKNGNGNGEFDYSQTSIHSYSIWSHAFGIAPAGSPFAGRLFYMLSQDASSSADSLKLMYSTNNGTTWAAAYWIPVNGYTINHDEMDIEVVYDGTNTWVFGVVGFRDGVDNRKKVYFFRYNVNTTATYGTMLNFPGSGTGMNYYNPRITSDNSNFTSNAYVMILCSMDSLVGATHYTKQKYALSSSPFDAAPSLNYAQPNGSSGFGWAGSSANTTYLYGDIAYYKDDGGSGENRVMTVYGNNGSGINNVYIAFLSGYTALGSTLYISEPGVNKDVKIAFNGGSNNRNGMITYVRQFSSTDWDIFGFRTTTGGNTVGSWTRDTVDYSTDYARTCDLIAVRNASNQFKITYVQDNPGSPRAYFRQWNGSSWSAKYQISSTLADTQYAAPRAAYISGGGDDGAGVWSLIDGYNGYFVKQVVTTTGITQNNEIPSGFSLSQNYPNPFNPVTNIKFSIPKAGLVTLKVYDLAGKEIASLVNQNMNAGSYTFDFDASGFSSGAYFYRLSSDGFTDVKKMMLVK